HPAPHQPRIGAGPDRRHHTPDAVAEDERRLLHRERRGARPHLRLHERDVDELHLDQRLPLTRHRIGRVPRHELLRPAELPQPHRTHANLPRSTVSPRLLPQVRLRSTGSQRISFLATRTSVSFRAYLAPLSAAAQGWRCAPAWYVPPRRGRLVPPQPPSHSRCAPSPGAARRDRRPAENWPPAAPSTAATPPRPRPPTRPPQSPRPSSSRRS